jgi:hypothetical protein
MASRRVRWAVAAVIAVLAGAVTAASTGGEGLRQPIRFNHALHGRLNTSCDVCHRGALTAQAAGRPHAALCAECHDAGEDPLGKSAEEEALRALLRQGVEIPWRRLSALAPDVRFSHGLHAGKREIGCERCHGDIGSTESPPGEPLMRISMDECVRCHEEGKAATDCLACHK